MKKLLVILLLFFPVHGAWAKTITLICDLNSVNDPVDKRIKYEINTLLKTIKSKELKSNRKEENEAKNRFLYKDKPNLYYQRMAEVIDEYKRKPDNHQAKWKKQKNVKITNEQFIYVEDTGIFDAYITYKIDRSNGKIYGIWYSGAPWYEGKCEKYSGKKF